MSAWILRLPFHRPTIGGSRPVVVLHITAEGQETELENLELGPISPTLDDLVHEEIVKGHPRLILDLYGVAKLDASGIGEIAAAYVHARDAGGELVLASLSPEARDAFRITKLDSKIPVYDSTAEAVRHFGS